MQQSTKTILIDDQRLECLEILIHVSSVVQQQSTTTHCTAGHRRLFDLQCWQDTIDGKLILGNTLKWGDIADSVTTRCVAFVVGVVVVVVAAAVVVVVAVVVAVVAVAVVVFAAASVGVGVGEGRWTITKAIVAETSILPIGFGVVRGRRRRRRR